jgi:hypothetical protein
MSTTPPEQPGATGPGTPTGATPPAGAYTASRPMVALPATLPIPGNAEIVFVVLAALALGVLAWIADGISDRDWWTTMTVLAAAYLISRGIAKASRVFEQ